ncbi:hypothetical protein GcM3_212032 [Golovinomyces cichoracearum]|uniref:Uncharacterized protein n=1 Tax=Golovinomyces cichoracearum TaxID=62708 RepID=A0A420H9M9_9PEZI|nr:hypothetical protein GcM3_212032 [Golovinomyces cichoracearum]
MKCQTTLALFAFSHVVLAVPQPWHQATSEHADRNSLLSARDHEHLPISARSQAVEELIRDEEIGFSTIENDPNENERKSSINRRAPSQSVTSGGLFRPASVDWDTSRSMNRKGNNSDDDDDEDDEYNNNDDDDDDDDEDDDDDDEKEDDNKKAKPGFFQRIKNMFKFRKSNKDDSDQ